uniref:Major facilitator superfamily (MFS) profile domain-containing protein n=1 Tax=Strigamia maritima TaxID=126957 RepID=T1JHQ2_STRMM
MNSLRKRQILVFLTGWVAYAATYLLRKPLGVIKSDLETSLAYTKFQLGWLDTALLLPYACIQIFLGSLGDRLGARITMSLGLVMSGIALLSFSMWTNFFVMVALFGFCGAAQGFCWPNMCKILGSWYSDAARNSIFGMFGTSAFVGGVFGTFLAVHLQSDFGWRHVFFVPSLIVIGLGVVTFFVLNTPSELNTVVPGKDIPSPIKNGNQPTLWSLWKIPMVFEIALAMFCLKLVRYCMYMWLPLYLLQSLQYTKESAGAFSTVFEIGGVMGSALLGIVTDKFFGGRSLTATTVSTGMSTVALLLFFATGNYGFAMNAVFMAMAGALNCGPDTILGGSLPAQIGDSQETSCAAGVTGLVNGFGSVGACLEGPIVGYISQTYGWDGMFYFILFLSAVGTLSTYRAHLIESKQRKLYLPLTREIVQ